MQRSTAGWEIRPARPSDLPAVARLLAAQALPDNDLPSHREDFVVAVAGADVIGSAGLERYLPDVLLRSVAVAPAWRGAGLGAALTEAVLARARRLEAHAAYLLTTSAAPYFAARGFTPIGRDRLPAAIAASPQATRLCPQAAQAMHLSL